MRFGCHAVLFAGKIAQDPEGVVAALKGAQPEGIEVGARFFGVENSQRLKDIMDHEKLELSGLHVSVLLSNILDDPDACWAQLESAAKFLQVMPNKNIIMTGGLALDDMSAPNLGDDRLCLSANTEIIAKRLNEFAHKTKESYGVTLHYHNHDWEFRNDAVLFRALEEYAPELFLALDIGWLAVGGYDPMATITKHAKRIAYLHLRDYNPEAMARCNSFAERQNAYCPIGQGRIDFSKLLPAMEKLLGKDFWAVVEYETGEVDADRYKQALDYLRSINLTTGAVAK